MIPKVDAMHTVLFHLSKTARNVQSGIISKNAWNVQGVVSFQRTLGMFRMVPYHASKSKVYTMNKSSECIGVRIKVGISRKAGLC